MKYLYIGRIDKKRLAKTAECEECLRRDCHGQLSLICDDEQDRDSIAAAILTEFREGERLYIRQIIEKGKKWFVSHADCKEKAAAVYDRLDTTESTRHTTFDVVRELLDEDARACLDSLTLEYIINELFVEWTEDDEDEFNGN